MSPAGPLAAYGRHRYAVLFYTLLVTLGAAPLLAALHFSTDLLQILLVFSLLAALLGVPGQRWRGLLMVVAAIALGVRAAPTAAVGSTRRSCSSSRQSTPIRAHRSSRR